MRTRYLYHSANGPHPPGDIEAAPANHVAPLLPTVKYRTFGGSGQGVRWTAIVEGNLVRFTAADDSGVTSGVARRSP